MTAHDAGLTDGAMAETSEKGPFTSTETKTIRITGPIEISLTTKYESSHVPPTTSVGVASTDKIVNAVVAALQPFAEAIIRKLEEFDTEPPTQQ